MGVAVLLVEDSPGDASLVNAALAEAEGIQVIWAPSLETALSELRSGGFSCVLADLGLPDCDGLDVVDALRAVGEVPVIVLTGRTEEGLGLRAVRRGADDYLVKNEFTARELRRALLYAIERGQANHQLESLSRRARVVTAALGDGIVVVDARGTIESVNSAAIRLLGPALEQAVGRPISGLACSFIRRDGRALTADERPSTRALTTGDSIAVTEIGVQVGAGERAWVDLRADPLRSPRGELDGVVLCLRDIRPRLAASEAQRFQGALLESLAQAVVVRDPAGNVVFWNKAASRLYGWPAEEALGRPAGDTAAADRSPEHDVAAAAALASGESWAGDVNARRRDGSTFPAMLTETPVLDDAGRILAVISVASDITERKEAEETARALSTIVTSTADAIITLSLDGEFLTWNRGAEELFGYPAAEVVGAGISLLQLADNDDFACVVAALRAGETVRGLEVERRRRDGTNVFVSLTISPLCGRDGQVIAASAIARDVTERRRMEAEMAHQSLHDMLTELPNRVLLADRLDQALARAQRTQGPVSVLFCDLDHFKGINDTHGHAVGDAVLVEAAHRLTQVVRPSDTVARFGGDEFVIIAEGADEAIAQQVSERIARRFLEPFSIGGHRHHVSVSIGVAISPPVDADAGLLLRYADAAMYDAKGRGRAQSRVFDRALAEESCRRQELADDLRDAIRGGELQLHYQPQIELASGRLIGVEALARWAHPVHGWIPPDVFVGVAEQSGLAFELDRWVLQQACRDAAVMLAEGTLPAGGRVAVNRSSRTVAEPQLVDEVRTLVRETGLSFENLDVEVTETGLVTDIDKASSVLRELRELGVSVSLDDFGTGYSSLTYLRKLPISALKIDRSFVQHIVETADDLAICTAVVDLARAVGLRSVAEGVETPEQLAAVYRLGCQAGQGFLWSKALPLAELATLLSDPEHRFVAGQAVPAVAMHPHKRGGPQLAVTNEHGLHLIVRMHREGASLRTIAAALNQAGYRTPAGLRWHFQSVARAVGASLSRGVLCEAG
jgi:diguanylate cyclase (GGDEF)-like protein/PAS domain S-box-containing protein